MEVLVTEEEDSDVEIEEVKIPKSLIPESIRKNFKFGDKVLLETVNGPLLFISCNVSFVHSIN